MNGRDFLALVRIPTVFSSMSNAFAGYYIGGGRGWSPALAAGIAASALFIMAGMALNDIADTEVDQRERPTRPIPSGAVSPAQAWSLSLGMMLLGMCLLWLANPLSAAVGAALCLAIFAYNFLLKGSFLGPAAMGLCRALNLAAGISLPWQAWPDPGALPKTVLLALFSLWAYIALVTFLARDEVGGNTRLRARLFLGGLATWFLAWAMVSYFRIRTEAALAMIWALLGLSLRNPLRNLAREPSPRHTGQMVGALLRLVPLVDVMAMLANQVPLPVALCGALWIVPAYFAGKMFYTT
jgi:4-hydroxybenzoate polyprenyltransferase